MVLLKSFFAFEVGVSISPHYERMPLARCCGYESIESMSLRTDCCWVDCLRYVDDLPMSAPDAPRLFFCNGTLSFFNFGFA